MLLNKLTQSQVEAQSSHCMLLRDSGSVWLGGSLTHVDSAGGSVLLVRVAAGQSGKGPPS